MTQLGVAGKGAASGTSAFRHSDVKRGTLYGKVMDGVPVADLLPNGLKMAAIRGAGHDALRYMKRSLERYFLRRV
jgi:hypothetical protein